jgi:hypothetical protein
MLFGGRIAMPVTQNLRRLAALAGLMLIAAAPARPEGGFVRTEGLNLNAFVRQGPVSAHVVLRSGTDPRIIVAFPAGNSGTGLWFARLSQPAEWVLVAPPVPLTVADAKARPLYGTRLTATIHAPRLIVRQAILSSIRVLRDYQALGTAPVEVLTDAASTATTLSWQRDRLDGAPGYMLSLRILRGTLHGTTIDADGGAITLEVTAASGETPLTPVSGDALLNAGANADTGARDALTYLSYREKYLAGSWRFDTYFGRDTLMSVRLLMPALRPAAVETGLRSVLERLSPKGEVAHEEDIGEFAILDHRRQDGSNSSAPVYDYKMIDSDFLLAPVARAWLVDSPLGRKRSVAFLAEKMGGGRVGDRLMRNLRLVSAEAAPFAQAPTVSHLISLKPGVPVGEWRDSNSGLGGGRLPYDVNAVLVPAALEAASALAEAGLLTPYATAADRAMLAGLARTSAVWRSKAPSLFALSIPAERAQADIRTYAAKIGVPADPALRAVAGAPVRFHALSLNADGSPVPVQNSDEGFALLFGDPTPDQLDIAAETMMRPFPAGLRTGVGMLVANPVFAAPQTQALFGANAYHGTVIWSWQQALAAAGLARQLSRTDLSPGLRHRLGVVQSCLWEGIDATHSVQSSELWSWSHSNGRYQVAPFGASGGDADESNAAQLWSTVYLALRRPLAAPQDRCPA